MQEELKPLSKEAEGTLKWLGNFGPTINAKDRQIKGYALDVEDGGTCKTYINSSDLREMANHFIEVADWLDTRATEQDNRIKNMSPEDMQSAKEYYEEQEMEGK